MTMARSLITSDTWEIFFEAPLEAPPVAKRFPVMLHKRGGRWNEFFIGHVVTHLDLETWCSWKGYKLVSLHPGTRAAYPDEKTDLF